MIENNNILTKSQLLKIMHRTKGARFEALYRLQKKYNFSTLTVSFLSFIVIVITLYIVMFNETDNTKLMNSLTFISVSVSIFIIILSLHQAGEQYLLRAEMMHNCAREILAIYRKLQLANIDDTNLEKFTNKYQRVIDRYPYNHEPIDLEIYLFKEKYKDVSHLDIGQTIVKNCKGICLYSKLYWSIYGINLIYIVIPLVLVGWIILINEGL